MTPSPQEGDSYMNSAASSLTCFDCKIIFVVSGNECGDHGIPSASGEGRGAPPRVRVTSLSCSSVRQTASCSGRRRARHWRCPALRRRVHGGRRHGRPSGRYHPPMRAAFCQPPRPCVRPAERAAGARRAASRRASASAMLPNTTPRPSPDAAFSSQ
jgi:hypothetical protein